ncbi:protein FAR-RED IMPAIRED RESPONSE 1-like [Cajanus cajan]|uniref:protein FAR-RED IMPAIRED RESPONSE 1-like n=1 Tax=Cajanus cajan TaxID=3821 RepID=UPI00098D9DA4|nr:protein FAR-RED IMPAIRED RESPONSE 1-like [Cajanus cajan]
MSDQCESHVPLDINSSGCEENLISHSPQECKLEIDSSDENDVFPVPQPQPGMVFSSEAEARLYYTKYANQVGFRVMTRTSKKGRDGKVKYLILVCSEITRHAFAVKQYCAARINLTLRKDGTYRINAVTLGHSHELGSHHLIPSDIDTRGKRTLDEKVIDMGVERISDQNGCKNYVQRERRLKGENGDAEALQKYLVRMQEQDRNFFYAIELDDFFSVRNVWADGRSRAAYESLGDVVTVDTFVW